MTRGGARVGAGRKAKLSLKDRLRIGAEYANRWNKLAEEQAIARLDVRFAGAEIDADLQLMQNVQPGQARKQVLSLAELPQANWSENVPESISDAAEALKNREINLNKSRRIETVRRPYGAREHMEVEIAAWATEHFGVRIVSSYVRDCIEEYRAFVQECRAYQPSE